MSECTFEEFLSQFSSEALQLREDSGEGLRMSFVQTCWKHSPMAEDEDEIQSVFLPETRLRGRPLAVDGYFYSDYDETLYLVIADWNSFASEKTLTKTIAERMIGVLRNFYEFSKNGLLKNQSADLIEPTTPEYDLVCLINETNIERVHFIIFSDSRPSERLKEISIPELQNVSCDAQVWTLERLYEYDLLGKRSEPLVFDFSSRPIPLTLAAEGPGFKSYLGVIPALSLAGLYNKHGGRLLEGNVRSFLTLKTKVNKQIRNSIINTPDRFFIYNNGIAVTARNLKFNKSGELIEATDFQIINGGQTTASLARVLKHDKAVDNPEETLSRISVAIKVTEIGDTLSQEDAEELVAEISCSSNSQNAVSKTDLTSNKKFHINLEKLSLRIMAPAVDGRQYQTFWFYERNRGKYEQSKSMLDSAKLRQFESQHPKEQCFKKEDVAKAYFNWGQRPYISGRGAVRMTDLFTQEVVSTWDDKRDAGVYSDQYFRNCIALIIMTRKLEKDIPKQVWYQKGYRANIVAYTIAVFSMLFQARYGQDSFKLGEIWSQQKLPVSLANALLGIAKKVLETLTDPNRQIENVTEWAKKEDCWKNMKSVFSSEKFYQLPEAMETFVVSLEARKEAKHEAKEQARTDQSVDALTQVIKYAFWADALQYDRKIKVLTPSQEAAIKKADAFCRRYTSKLPSPKEAASALVGLEALREEGFNH
ncbi:MAG: AIPR family protein [Duodenibacillus sp.]|nr:AIPR family protein [Duodenibacillus sp.]